MAKSKFQSYESPKWRKHLEIQPMQGVVCKKKAVKSGAEAKIMETAEEFFKEPAECPVKHFVSTVDILARAERDAVTARLKVVICVMKVDDDSTPVPQPRMATKSCAASLCSTTSVSHPGMACVKLMPSGVAVRDISCRTVDPKADAAKDGEASSSQAEKDKEEKEKDSPGRVAFIEGATHFFTDTPGIFYVEFTVDLGYLSTMKQAVNFFVPRATQCNFTAIVPYTGIEVSIPQSVLLEQLDEEENFEGEKPVRVTRIEAVIIPTNEIQVKWTKVRKQEPPKPKRDEKKATEIAPLKVAPVKEMILTSGQDIMHSVGGGICVSTLHQHYTITNGSVNSFTIAIDGSHGSAPHHSQDLRAECLKTRTARVLNVDGSGLHRWDVEDDPDQPRGQLLKLFMESAVQGTVHFTVTVELEMLGTSCCIVCPTFTPVGTNRNKGSIAVQARTAVEIQEIESRHLSKVDVQEMPPKLKSQPDSVLQAYKFLTASSFLALEVTKHSDVEVLVATAEEALYTVTHTGEHLYYHMFLKVRNTQRQFARVNIPAGSTIWSCLLSGSAVKPAMESATSTVLIPLQKGTSDLFNAELIFVRPADLGTDLSLELPSVDIPINHLFVKLWMPVKHKYAEWHGGEMRELDHWSTTPKAEYEILAGAQGGGGAQPSEWMYELSPSSGHGGPPVPQGTGDVASGIRPLTFKTTPLHTGRAFILEKLLVGTKATITLKCETCQRDKKKRRTLASQQPWFDSCNIV
eukprot:TRINITY_DN1701_c0_g1_i1.p1 TRINITY_DN1701_c0_g1~~TRINITY_DN1701_c0_g1_i1.p1  ORF type:complete len:747 (+),score=320.09 TRINITY_DN1701_c0_g1_i1:60-2300(+)